MSSYNIIKEHHLGDNPDQLSMSPYWVMAVVRFENPVTYSRGAGESFSKFYPDAVKVRGQPLIITDSCVSVSVSSTKTTHVSQMNATLLPSTRFNYLSEVLPGDWCFVWMMHDLKTRDRIIKAIQSSQQANDFYSGLKFMGRINGCRKAISLDPGSGILTTRYNITACGFTEFDSVIYYEPHLAEKIPALGQHWARIGGKLNEWIKENGQGISVKDALVFFLDLLMGQGVPVSLGRGNTDPRLVSTAGLAAPYSYIIPSPVGAILGKTVKTKTGGTLAYADVVEFLYGIQRYGDMSFGNNNEGQLFNPEGARGPGSRRFTGTQMLGSFIPTPPQFTNRSVWSVLNQYLNPAVNELYATLRANPDGNVVPTLVARQLPFSTDLAPVSISPTSSIVEKVDPKELRGIFDGNLATTKFLDLPRWVAHPILLKRLDVGRSDSLRVNFVHVYGDSGRGKPAEQTSQVVRYPPRRDDLDIARNGFRPFMQTVACSNADIRLGDPEKWMAILSDIMMGQHMTLTGTVEMVGVQAPICPGDNFELDDTVFHIEAVTHTCSISNNQKVFTTVLALSHGVAKDPTGGNLGIYSGIDDDDLRHRETSLTVEGEDFNDQNQMLPRDAGTVIGGGALNLSIDPTRVGI